MQSHLENISISFHFIWFYFSLEIQSAFWKGRNAKCYTPFIYIYINMFNQNRNSRMKERKSFSMISVSIRFTLLFISFKLLALKCVYQICFMRFSFCWFVRIRSPPPFFHTNIATFFVFLAQIKWTHKILDLIKWCVFLLLGEMTNKVVQLS